LESIHGDRIIIRNSDVVNGTIVNHSVPPGHLIFVKLILPASENINTAVAEIDRAIQGFSPELEKANPSYRPKVVVETAAFGYVTIEVHAYVAEMLDYGPEKTRLYLLAANSMTNAGLKPVL